MEPQQPPPPPMNQPTAPPPPLMYASPRSGHLYETAAPRAKRTVVAIWITIALQLLMIWPYVDSIRDFQRIAEGTYNEDEVKVVHFFALGVGLLMVAAYIVQVVFWMMWVHRTYRNLPSLGAKDLSYSPGWAVGYYFIPILNLFRPYQVMRQTWQASDPRYVGERDWKLIAAPALLGFWWAMHLISSIVNQASMRVGMRSEDTEVLHAFAWVDLFMVAFDIGLALIEIKLVLRLTALQDERAQTRGTIDPGPLPVKVPSLWHP